jgi:hypothetical protein
MKMIPYKAYSTKAVGLKAETVWGGLVIYELVGADKGDLEAVRFRYEYRNNTMSYMRTAKVRWAIPKRKAYGGEKPVTTPYFNTKDGRIYLDEVEACSPGWGPLW